MANPRWAWGEGDPTEKASSETCSLPTVLGRCWGRSAKARPTWDDVHYPGQKSFRSLLADYLVLGSWWAEVVFPRGLGSTFRKGFGRASADLAGAVAGLCIYGLLRAEEVMAAEGQSIIVVGFPQASCGR